MIEIIPAILTNDPQELREILAKCERAAGPDGPLARRVQIDIIDGVFAKNKTIDPSLLESVETNLKIDFHLMTKDPIDWVERCIRGMADRIIGQIEQMTDQLEFVGKVQEMGAKVGLALDLNTPVSRVDSTILSNLDVVLVMAVKAGFGGQKFDPSALSTVKDLVKIKDQDSTPFKICVDGGETQDVIDDTHFAGADEVAIGRRLFEGDLGENIERFQKAAHKLVQ